MPNIVLHNEEELLEQVASGSEAAFTALFEAYHQWLGAYIYRLTNSMELAEEIVQDVFLKVWIYREKLLQVQNFESYLYVMSKNHTFNCLRKIAKEQQKRSQLKEKLATHWLEEKETFSADYYRVLDQAVEQLPPQQRKAYILSRRKRLKYDEVAKKMDISRETVKKYLQHATHSITLYAQTHKDLLMLPILIVLLITKR